MKSISKEGLFINNGIEPNEFNSEMVYKMIRNNNVDYESLSKENIVKMILGYVNSNKKFESNLLNKKKVRDVKSKNFENKGNSKLS